jgi:hypothetical protein
MKSNYRQSILLLTLTCAFVLITSSSFAATTAKKAKKAAQPTTTTTTTTTRTETSTTTTTSTVGALEWNLGVAAGTTAEKFHAGALISGMLPITKIDIGTLLIGGQTGFLYGPSTPSTYIIPILAVGQLNLQSTGSITPYFGLGMGIGILHVNLDNSVVSVGGISISTDSYSGTHTDIALLAKAGLNFGDHRQFFAELPLGTLGKAFSILPTVGMKF